MFDDFLNMFELLEEEPSKSNKNKHQLKTFKIKFKIAYKQGDIETEDITIKVKNCRDVKHAKIKLVAHMKDSITIKFLDITEN